MYFFHPPGKYLLTLYYATDMATGLGIHWWAKVDMFPPIRIWTLPSFFPTLSIICVSFISLGMVVLLRPAWGHISWLETSLFPKEADISRIHYPWEFLNPDSGIGKIPLAEREGIPFFSWSEENSPQGAWWDVNPVEHTLAFEKPVKRIPRKQVPLPRPAVGSCGCGSLVSTELGWTRGRVWA